jgi:hypothetical protein
MSCSPNACSAGGQGPSTLPAWPAEWWSCLRSQACQRLNSGMSERRRERERNKGSWSTGRGLSLEARRLEGLEGSESGGWRKILRHPRLATIVLAAAPAEVYQCCRRTDGPREVRAGADAGRGGAAGGTVGGQGDKVVVQQQPLAAHPSSAPTRAEPHGPQTTHNSWARTGARHHRAVNQAVTGMNGP